LKVDVISYTNENTKDIIGAATLNNRETLDKPSIFDGFFFF